MRFCKDVLILFLLQYVCFVKPKLTRKDNEGPDINNNASDEIIDEDTEKDMRNDSSESDDCKKSFNMRSLYTTLDELDERFSNEVDNFNEEMVNGYFDKEMTKMMIRNRGIAERTLYHADGDKSRIPAGINLGGYCMVKLPKSILFIHRMKLLNTTVFNVKSIKSDFKKMVLKANLSLNDLHLFGTYSRTQTDIDPHLLYYRPHNGEVQFLMKNVQYTVEGRYRLLRDRLTVEHVISKLQMDDALMMYKVQNNTVLAGRIRLNSIDEFLQRLRNDLDKWIKDYFNDYLMYHVAVEDKKFQEYEKEKTLILNDNVDKIINTLIKRVHEINATSLSIPDYSLVALNGMKFHLKDGSVLGMESMYRRSPATGSYEDESRKLNAIVAFSDLKVKYRYEAILSDDYPPMAGELVYTGDDLNALLTVLLLKNSDVSDINFIFLEHTKPETLTVEGPANRMLTNWKPWLERHIIAIMSNTLINYVSVLGNLSKCVLELPMDTNYGDSEIPEIKAFTDMPGFG